MGAKLMKTAIQTKRTKRHVGWRKYFWLEWESDMMGGLMVASITLFGVSFVLLGTSA